MLERDIYPAIGAIKADEVPKRAVIKILDEVVARGAKIRSNRVLALLARHIVCIEIALGREEMRVPCAERPRRHAAHFGRAALPALFSAAPTATTTASGCGRGSNPLGSFAVRTDFLGIGSSSTLPMT